MGKTFILDGWQIRKIIRNGGAVLAPALSLTGYEDRKGVDNEPNIER